MYVADTSSDLLGGIDTLCKSLVVDLMRAIKLPSEPLSRDNPGDLVSAYKGKLFLITSGVVRFESQGRTICHFDDGDLVGLPLWLGQLQGRLIADSLIEFHLIDAQQLMDVVQKSADWQSVWTRWLVADASRTFLALSLTQPAQSRPPFGLRHVAPGEMMISQGSEPDEVFAIIEGSADVFHNGTKVGEVTANEIFGAMAFLTSSPRSADVVAREACTVMVVPGDDFHSLLRSHPHICMNLLHSMARQVSAMNQQVHDLLRR